MPHSRFTWCQLIDQISRAVDGGKHESDLKSRKGAFQRSADHLPQADQHLADACPFPTGVTETHQLIVSRPLVDYQPVTH